MTVGELMKLIEMIKKREDALIRYLRKDKQDADIIENIRREVIVLKSQQICDCCKTEECV